MASIAKIAAFPDRRFAARYWSLPGGKDVWIYMSVETVPHMLAVDLADPDPNLEPVVARMRAGQAPFREATEERTGVYGRFLVSEIAG